MAFDPSRVFTASSGRTAAILCILAVIGVLIAFTVRMFGFKDKFPRDKSHGPPLMGGRGDEKKEDKKEDGA